MRIYISAGMKGVTGVTHSQDVIPGRSQYERFRGLLTADVNAAIEVGLVTGDDLACAEAESLYAGVQTARVKTAVDRYTARCLSPQVARERIREAAPRAGGKGDLTPYTPEPPYSFTIEFATASPAASVLFFPGPERVDDRRVSWTHEDYETAFKMFIGVMRLSRSDPDYG
jgi:D-amino peptidase